MTISAADVEGWLDANPDYVHDYFLRKADITLINKWLLGHGFSTVHEFLSTNFSQNSSGQTSPDPRGTSSDSGFFSESTGNASRHTRSNSKKFLRQDFARSRMRSMFRTHDPQPSIEQQTTLAERRSSLKGMRQFLSLPPTSGNILSMLIQSKVRLPRYASKDEDHKRELHASNDKDFFLEIVRDISHELDFRCLTSRILVNISILLDSDRSSLFFVEGPKGKQTLVSKVFDVYTGTSCFPTSRGDNIIRIPWGEGIIGYVAESGHTVNITDASADPRYKDDVDRVIGYTTDSLLCMPISNADAEIIAVVQVINSNNSMGFFTKDDEKVLETYLAFCGLAISNAQAIESYTREYDRNKALLEVVHDLFEEQTSVESIVTKIMQRAQTLLKCERCVVMLKDENKQNAEKHNVFGRVFDLQQPVRNGQHNSPSPLLGRPNNIAEIVASTGETINLTDATTHKAIDGGLHAKSIICKPIRDNHFQTIGVAQLINKVEGAAFDDADDQLFEAFCIFCGLGINNCMLFDVVSRETAKQAVSLEVLSYHASVNTDDVMTFKAKKVPECHRWSLDKPLFNDFSLNSDEMILAAVRIFKDMGFIKKFKIDYETLVRWVLTVRKNYRNIAYHNWRHAFNVCQFMFVLLNTCGLQRHLCDLERLALIVGCICHDLDHRGTNNAFQQKVCSPLATLYGTQATMEHHHFNHAVMILQSDGHNIFSNVGSTDYSTLMQFTKHAILATDLSLHIQVRGKFFPLVESGLYSWDDREQRELLRSILMTTCDIATISKHWEIQRRAADLVVTEFFDQGDKEKAMFKTTPQALMDRERQDELPRLQMEWIDGICLPLFKSLVKMDAVLLPMLDQVMENRSHWAHLDQQRLQKTVDKQILPGGFKETHV